MDLKVITILWKSNIKYRVNTLMRQRTASTLKKVFHFLKHSYVKKLTTFFCIRRTEQFSLYCNGYPSTFFERCNNLN